MISNITTLIIVLSVLLLIFFIRCQVANSEMVGHFIIILSIFVGLSLFYDFEETIDDIVYSGGGVASDKYMRMELMDPKHNMREIAKQMILVEDHMAHKRKRCVDCITKHYLMIEALLEEAITLDKDGNHTDEINNIINSVKPTMMAIIDKIKGKKIKEADYLEACQKLREIRKDISVKYVLHN